MDVTTKETAPLVDLPLLSQKERRQPLCLKSKLPNAERL
jgi:hypothetical protein